MRITKHLITLVGLTAGLALILAPAAFAWPKPPHALPPSGSVQICHSVGDGRFELVTATTQADLDAHRAHRRDHLPENARCEGPIVPPPNTPPSPPVTPPSPPVVPPVPTPPVPPVVPPTPCAPGTACCPICISARQQRIVLSRYARVSPRSSSVTRYERVVSARMTFTRARPQIVLENQRRALIEGNPLLAGDPYGERVTVPMRFRQVPSMGGRRLVAIADWRQLRAVRGQVFHVTVRGRVSTGETFRLGRSYRLCMRADGDLNEPSDQRRD